MMFIYGIDNNILNYGTRILRVYQEKYKITELYQKMIFLGGNQTEKTDESAVNVYPSICIF